MFVNKRGVCGHQGVYTVNDSQLQGPCFDPDFGLLSVCGLHVSTVSLWVSSVLSCFTGLSVWCPVCLKLRFKPGFSKSVYWLKSVSNTSTFQWLIFYLFIFVLFICEFPWDLMLWLGKEEIPDEHSNELIPTTFF